MGSPISPQGWMEVNTSCMEYAPVGCSWQKWYNEHMNHEWQTSTTTIPPNSQVFLLLYLWGQRRGRSANPTLKHPKIVAAECCEPLEPKWSIPIIHYNPIFLCMYVSIRFIQVSSTVFLIYMSMKWSKGSCVDICDRSVTWMVWEWNVWNSHDQEWQRDMSLPNFANCLKPR